MRWVDWPIPVDPRSLVYDRLLPHRTIQHTFGAQHPRGNLYRARFRPWQLIAGRACREDRVHAIAIGRPHLGSKVPEARATIQWPELRRSAGTELRRDRSHNTSVVPTCWRSVLKGRQRQRAYLRDQCVTSLECTQRVLM